MNTRRGYGVVIALILLVVPLLTGTAATPARQSNLVFDINNFSVENVLVGTDTITFRAYRGIVYVTNPAEIVFPLTTIYQKLNVFVPIEISLDDYKTHGGPIFLPNTVGGYNPGLPAEPTRNEVKTALAEGYVVVAPGARGRTNYNSAGIYNGKAPAAIVDLKAAVRYLRFNDKIMPGDAEMIISSGTSAGGALSTLLGLPVIIRIMNPIWTLSAQPRGGTTSLQPMPIAPSRTWITPILLTNGCSMASMTITF